MPALTSILEMLADGGVEFVLVGGLAAVAHGAPITTFDVDIVHRRDPENVRRLLEVLGSLHARYRGQPAGRALSPTPEPLLGPGHQLLATDLGPLDVLGSVEGGRRFEDLEAGSVVVDLGGRKVRVAGLELLIELKRGATHPKDLRTLEVLQVLRARRQ